MFQLYLSTFKKYVTFKGRATRKEYWTFVLLNMVFAIALALIGSQVGDSGAMMLLFYLATLLPSIAVAVRRLHDNNKSGWFFLLGFVPLANFYVLYLMLIGSQPGANNYGPNAV